MGHFIFCLDEISFGNGGLNLILLVPLLLIEADHIIHTDRDSGGYWGWMAGRIYLVGREKELEEQLDKEKRKKQRRKE